MDFERNPSTVLMVLGGLGMTGFMGTLECDINDICNHCATQQRVFLSG